MTCGMTWKTGQARQDQSMDQRGVLQRARTTIRPAMTGTTSPGPKTAYGLHPNCVVTPPDTEVPHTPYASPIR